MAGDAEWGQKMQDDKDDGAQWLIDQNIAKPGRIAIFGYSYGGYAAFAASVTEKLTVTASNSAPRSVRNTSVNGSVSAPPSFAV